MRRRGVLLLRLTHLCTCASHYPSLALNELTSRCVVVGRSVCDPLGRPLAGRSLGRPVTHTQIKVHSPGADEFRVRDRDRGCALMGRDVCLCVQLHHSPFDRSGFQQFTI